MAKSDKSEPKAPDENCRSVKEKCGSSDGKGVQFPVPSHHGLEGNENKPRTP